MSIIFSPTSDYLTSDYLISDSPGLVSTVSSLSPFQLPITVNLEYSKPLVSFYETIDNQPNIQKMITTYYYYKVLDQWLYDDLSDVLNYFRVSNGNVQLISSVDEYKPLNINLDDEQTIDAKIDFIQKNLFTKYDMYEVLYNLTKETKSKFVNLPKKEYFVKQAVRDYFNKKFREILRKNISRVSSF